MFDNDNSSASEMLDFFTSFNILKATNLSEPSYTELDLLS
jgi:hypothetical protein